MTSKDEERPYKKARLFGSLEEMVTLVAGKEKDKKSFMVHKNILCEASPFFKAACKPEWMKPGKNYITMPEDDAKVVRIMIYWIYHDEICIDKVKHEKDINTCEKTLGTPWGLFARLYIVGQKYQMPRLQNDAVDALLHCNNDWAIDACIIPWIYNHTTKGAILHFLASFLCREFLFDMTYALLDDNFYTLEYNEDLISKEKPKEDFCAELHVNGGCDGDCKEIKSYAEVLEGE